MTIVREKASVRGQAPWSSGLTVLLSIFVFLPLHGFTLQGEPDLSFGIVHHHGFANGLQWGVDLVSTYGPWGFLFRGFHPATDLLLFALNGLIGAAFGLALAVHLQPVQQGWLRSLISVGVFALLSFGGSDTRYLGFFLLATLRLTEREKPSFAVERVVVLIALGLLALIKFSYFLLACGIAGVLAMREILLLRRVSRDVVILFSGVITFWLLAGQNPVNIPRWVRLAAEVAAGYSQGGVLLPRPGDASDSLFAVSACALLIVSFYLGRNIRGWKTSAVRTAGLAVCLWFVFKASFVRFDDSHSVTGASCLALLALMILPVEVRGLPGRAKRALSVVFCLASACALWLGLDSLRARGAWMNRLVRDRSSLARLHTENLLFLRKRSVIPPITGRIDSLHTGQASLLAWGLDYAPRPVFHSYLAWSEGLGQLNARHFSGPAAPDYLWIEFFPIDGHPPLLEDGPAWLEIAARYRPSARNHPLLECRDAPLTSRRTLRLERSVRVGEAIVLPEGEVLWAEIRTRPTFPGWLVRTLIRGPVQSMEMTFPAGPVRTYRFSPGAEGGFILTPLHEEAEFRAWLEGLPERPPGARARTLTFRSSARQRFMQGSFEVRVWELEFR